MITAEFLIPFLFYKLPEAFLLIAAALGLLGLRPRPGRLFLTSLGLGVLTEVSRYFLFSSGWHTPVILLGIILALILGFGLSVSTAITGCFLSLFLLRMGDSLLVAPLLKLLKLTYQGTLGNPWSYVAFGWVSAGFLVIAVVLCYFARLYLIKAPEAQKEAA